MSKYFQEYFPIFFFQGTNEIDECKLAAKLKGTHGRPPAKGPIIFGIKNRESGIFRLFPIKDKKESTIIPIITDNISKNSIIISDKFSTYVTKGNRSKIQDKGYNHFFINHSKHFVDPI